MAHPFVIVDVFTDRALAGNQLAVFTVGAAVPEALLQDVAREMGFSESTFVYAGDRVRIFTPGTELPFAGHPVLGTAAVLARSRHTDAVTLQTGRGPVAVTFEPSGRGRMVQPEPAVAAWDGSTDELFAALGVTGSDLPVEVYDNGPRHLYVVLASAAEVAALRPDMGRLAAACPDAAVNVGAPDGPGRWKTRMFGPTVGVDEDPATGSAAGPWAVHLCRHGRLGWGEELLLTQGVEIKRPSTLYATAWESGRVEVAGDTVFVGWGTLDLPSA